MMLRLVVLIVLAAVGVGIALLVQRRRPDPPSAPSYRAPAQLDRAEFAGADRETLVAVFTSSGCESCRGVWETVGSLETDEIAVTRIEVETDASTHKRYSIDGVPTTVVANSEGVVTSAFFGPLTREELISALPD